MIPECPQSELNIYGVSPACVVGYWAIIKSPKSYLEVVSEMLSKSRLAKLVFLALQNFQNVCFVFFEVGHYISNRHTDLRNYIRKHIFQVS